MEKNSHIKPALAVTLTVAVALRILFMARCFIDPEELMDLSVVAVPSFADFFEAAVRLDRAFLDILILRFVHSISDSEIFMRSFQLGLSLVFMLVAWRAVREITKNRETALLVMIVIALSPLHTYFACILRYHNLTYIFTTLSILYLWRLAYEPFRWSNAVLYGAVSALSCMSHYYGFFFIAAQCATFAVLKIRDIREWPRMAAGAVFAAIFFLPWLPVFLQQLGHRSVDVAPATINIKERFGAALLNIVDVFFQFITGTFYELHGDLPIEKIILITCGLALSVCMGLLLTMAAGRRLGRPVLFCGVQLGFVVLISYFAKNLTDAAFHTKYLIPYAILFYMVIAMSIIQVRLRAARFAAAGLLIAVFLLGQSYMQAVAGDSNTIKNVAKAAAGVGDNSSVVFVNGVKCAMLYSYYTGAEAGRDYRVWNSADNSSVPMGEYYDIEEVSIKSRRELARVMKNNQKAWLFYCIRGPKYNMDVFNRLYDPENTLGGWFEENAILKESVDFKTSPRKKYFLGRALLYEMPRPD